MSAKLFVRSLAYSVTDESLAAFFAPVGTVVSAKVIMDRDMGRSKGFGFVEMSSEAEAQDAIKQLDGHDLDGRNVGIMIAKPQEDRPHGDRPAFTQRNRY